jgi:hypothetical protein
MWVIMAVGSAILFYLFYQHFLYPAFLSPLAAIPNAHCTSAWSGGWVAWQRYHGQANRAIHDAHQRLGPVVRLGVMEISVNSVEAVNLVYSGIFEKDGFYVSFANYEYGYVTSRDSRPD